VLPKWSHRTGHQLACLQRKGGVSSTNELSVNCDVDTQWATSQCRTLLASKAHLKLTLSGWLCNPTDEGSVN
jgi:hypothetical protein